MSPDLKSTDFTSEFKGNPLVLQTLRAMIDPLVGAEFPLEQATEALELMDGRGAVGKIVLTTGR